MFYSCILIYILIIHIVECKYTNESVSQFIGSLVKNRGSLNRFLNTYGFEYRYVYSDILYFQIVDSFYANEISVLTNSILEEIRIIHRLMIYVLIFQIIQLIFFVALR